MKKNKSVTVVLSIIVILIIGSLIGYFISNKQNKTTKESQKINNTPPVTNINSQQTKYNYEGAPGFAVAGGEKVTVTKVSNINVYLWQYESDKLGIKFLYTEFDPISQAKGRSLTDVKESIDGVNGPGFSIKVFKKELQEDLLTAVKKYIPRVLTCNFEDSKLGSLLRKYSNLDTYFQLNISEGDLSETPCPYRENEGYYFASSKLFPDRFLLLQHSTQSPDDLIYKPETKETLRITDTVNLF